MPSYNDMIREATDAELLDGTAWLHLNPDYEGDGTPLPPMELTTSSSRSRHWSELNPAWLAQECLNRGVQDIGHTWQPIPGRVRRMVRQGNGWVIECHLGPAPARRLVDNALDPNVETDWVTYFVSDEKVIAGEGGALVHEEAA